MTEIPVFFSSEEMQQIRDAMRNSGDAVECPLCGQALAVRGPVTSEGRSVVMFCLDCKPCCRTAIITEPTENGEPDGKN